MSLFDIIRGKQEELRRVKDHEVAVVYDVFGNVVVEEYGDGSSANLEPRTINCVKSLEDSLTPKLGEQEEPQ